MSQKYPLFSLASATLFTALACAPFANAQSAVDVGLGFGSHLATATGTGIDNGSSPNAFGTCALNSGDTFCQATPKLNGLFMRLGGDIMFKQHFGGGFNFDFQPTRSDYGPLQYRQSFMDVNGIRTRYYEAGSGEPLLLVHGSRPTGTSSANTWVPVIRGLAQRYHVVAPDRRGHGMTDEPNAGYSPHAEVEHLHKIGRAHV